MKLFEDSSRHRYVGGGMPKRQLNKAADDLFLASAVDDASAKNLRR